MTELRSDIICEKTRSTTEIRQELAKQLRLWRKTFDTNDVRVAEICQIRIRVLKWVLRHDVSPQAYYKETYMREYPE